MFAYTIQGTEAVYDSDNSHGMMSQSVVLECQQSNEIYLLVDGPSSCDIFGGISSVFGGFILQRF